MNIDQPTAERLVLEFIRRYGRFENVETDLSTHEMREGWLVSVRGVARRTNSYRQRHRGQPRMSVFVDRTNGRIHSVPSAGPSALVIMLRRQAEQGASSYPDCRAPGGVRPSDVAVTVWRTEAVVSLARGMYESQDFAAMPVLADALEEPGCDDVSVLAHCRGPGIHARDCWVVGLLLGNA